ncbi:MAG: hypothetical protein AAF907_06250 [Planctomycetota bacterium]
MSVPVVCADCGKKLKAPDKARGKTLKCPACSGRISVPAAGGAAVASKSRRTKKRQPEPAMAGTGEFLAGLDLSRAEDRDTEVCPACGYVLETEEDLEAEECPQCGADLFTGGKGATALRKERFKDRGEDPKVFYSKAAGDAWTFLKKNAGIGGRLGLLTAISSLIGAACWVMVAYCANTPPKLFWGLFASVGTLFVPGCLWVLQEAVTDLTFDNKQKFKRFRFDVLDCVSKAPRMVVWAAVVAWPMLLLDAIGLAVWFFAETPWALVGALALHVLVAFLFWPVGLGHMAMPVSSPGWNFMKVAPGAGKNVGPIAYWAMLTFAAFLPCLAVLGGTAAFSGSTVNGVLNVMADNGALIRAAQAKAEESKQEYRAPDNFAEVDWYAFIIPGVALIPASFLFGFGAVYASRPAGLLARMFRPSLGLITLAKEKKYVPKIKRRSELDELDGDDGPGLTFKMVALMLVANVVLGPVVGVILSFSLENTSLLGGAGLGMMGASILFGFFARLTFLQAAANESTTWRWIVKLPLGELAFVISHFDAAKYSFVWQTGCTILLFVGMAVALIGGYDLGSLLGWE